MRQVATSGDWRVCEYRQNASKCAGYAPRIEVIYNRKKIKKNTLSYNPQPKLVRIHRHQRDEGLEKAVDALPHPFYRMNCH